jgi:hypothetical protein
VDKSTMMLEDIGTVIDLFVEENGYAEMSTLL